VRLRVIEIPPSRRDIRADDRVQLVGERRILGSRRKRDEHLPVHLVVIEVEAWITQRV
jgi:hypothetical protein